MGLSRNIEVLVDFASQVNFSHHYYISQDQQAFELTKEKSDPNGLMNLIQEIMDQEAHLDLHQQEKIHAALEYVETHLKRKISGWFSFLIAKNDKQRIRSAIDRIAAAQKSLAKAANIDSEEAARLKFYADLPKKLSVSSAAQKDMAAIKLISQKIWDAFQDSEEYAKHMKLFFEGEHYLFEEDHQDDDRYQLYDRLKDPVIGAYLRGSSHYDHGTTNGQTGGPVPTQQEILDHMVENPQYEIEGPQVKALLFGRVKLAIGHDNQPIFGKSFDQIAEEAVEKGESPPKNFRKYTFLQTEWAPDSDSKFTANFWKHRIFSFCLYVGRKILGFSKPNVGPYGYGHADKGRDPGSNPTVIA